MSTATYIDTFIFMAQRLLHKVEIMEMKIIRVCDGAHNKWFLMDLVCYFVIIHL
jgi:hypothetical protein